jgi:N-acetylneuraminate synthase
MLSSDNFKKLNGECNRPFIIAEMSGNHNQSLESAIDIVESAYKAGVDAIKIQTYTADTITLDSNRGDFVINSKDSLWSGKKLHELYKEAHTPWEWHKPIMQHANDLGIICFSSPFDESAVDFLEDLDCPIYKIASFEITHIPLIKKVASTGKPMIISTGMASVSEIGEAVFAAKSGGCNNITLLKCTSTYPASPIDSNVLTIPHMKKLFRCNVGLSDHTMGIGASIAAAVNGASVIEKHFTLDRSKGGVDSAFSLEPNELSSLVIETANALDSLGEVLYGATIAEEKSLMFRRSIYACSDIKKGDKFTTKNLKIVRPGFGLKPKYLKHIIKKTASKSIKFGEAISFDCIE